MILYCVTIQIKGCQFFLKKPLNPFLRVRYSYIHISLSKEKRWISLSGKCNPSFYLFIYLFIKSWYLAGVFGVMSISCLIIQQLDILISFLISYLLEYHNETMDLFWWRFNELWFILCKMINPKLLCKILLNADKIHIFYIIWKSKMGFLTRFWLQLM